jgi:hypothetical protein
MKPRRLHRATTWSRVTSAGPVLLGCSAVPVIGLAQASDGRLCRAVGAVLGNFPAESGFNI